MILRLLTSLLLLLTGGAFMTAQTPCGTVDILNPASISLCQGEQIRLQQTNTLNNPTYQWSPAAGFVDPVTSASPRVRPQASGFIRVTATGSDGCTVSDSIFVDVDVLVAPPLIDDLTVCQGTDLSLTGGPVDDTGNTIYTVFSNNRPVTGATAANGFTVRVDSASTYAIVARSENGACEERLEVEVDVIDGLFDIPQDTVFACLGVDSIVLTVVDTPFVANREITWSPTRFNLSAPTGRSFTVRPVADITYYAETTINGCRRIDSVAVRLDSLPADLSLMLEPEKDPYCQGDTFYVLSPVYDVGDFPIIEHEWTTAPGLQSPRDLYNAVFNAQDTATLTRITRNGACIDTATIDVNVVEPPVVTFSPQDTTVCPGEMVQIQATFQSGTGSLEWMDPTNTLSCTDCLDPIATLQTTTEYTIELITGNDECKAELSYQINVAENQSPELTTEVLLCPGDSRQLIVGGTVPGYTYRITGGGIDTNNPSVLLSPTETTTYTIETTGDCGTTTQTLQLVLATDYTVTASGPSTVCASDVLNLSAAVDPGSITGTYTWLLPNGTTQTGREIAVNTPQSGTYTVTFTDDLGCSTASDGITVEVLGEDITPIIVATLPDGTTAGGGDVLYAGNDVVLTVTNLPAGQNFTYAWTGNYSPGTASGQEITVTVPRQDDTPQPLNYSVTVTSEEGQCTYDASFFLPVEQSLVQIPDLFTPNGDGRNDEFRLFYNGTITDYTMIVYDRWGQKVFTSDDPQEGWDGTKNESPQPSDVYLYLAKFRQDGVELQEEGQVTLVR
ncbi:gliding motility-associated C-terminal domain-containing protein [Lewinella sp. IMCC34183]|uniref:T9SS type B sorting domain-containing protein n=1 Tax=Lewinella sp. IMCC34183 TaxID=2248762 RepID=UPI000E24EFB5|nr:gliding motility-associated C-terminal domain-containing protein [Lewinella sp. IMCC34183]